ncbi:hypothetical protein FAGKG844_110124 [Frankia sp. AgKG'84/4]
MVTLRRHKTSKSSYARPSRVHRGTVRRPSPPTITMSGPQTLTLRSAEFTRHSRINRDIPDV